ncbi:hypothetical protein QJ856_gp0021 [Tupanvirus deep ocean]|uniref:Uncharacterized protein n=2 Tax=Tupanvirus TaxID=2094720 RepID=A0AC62A6M9_9VIRU|nr:hypothetical protein QJ856_gp0021 [Tupanvirus deep ocean]QKU33439.1 hypothetical protein [Tupanvirus deep ocean]
MNSTQNNNNNSDNSNNNNNNNNGTNKDNINESFFKYSFEVISDIILGVVLGVTVNIAADFIAIKLGLPRIGLIIVQIFLICLVLYIMKIDSKYLYESWKGQTNYGIVFTAVFLAVQRNIIRFFEDIYIEETKSIGIFS